ncbi:MATE family efflux transporter [Niameybacter sp.]|uniref:MATE family efflux transporter n=2 Tax=Niameybacter sp. TaxID=2033640 RepID=UPI002FC72B7D
MIEQLLNSFMGMADTMMVSNVGSAAISAVSLVDSINVLVIQVFAAMGIGIGLMTVVGQCIGAGRKEEARYYIVKLTGYADDSCH